MKKKYFLVFIILLFSCSILKAETKNKNFQNNSETFVTEKIEETNKELTLSQNINNFFEPLVAKMKKILFWDPFEAVGVYDPVIYDSDGSPLINEKGEVKKSPIPFVVIWLVFGALFFTIFMKFINIRGFKTSINLIRGKYDNPNHKGEISHFHALTTALSATIGLGNIAGVAIALSIGGPGATFWMIVVGLLGMSSKFVECSLSVKYRKINKDGSISGGPMYYLKKTFADRNMKYFGGFLSVLFAILIVIGSFGIGNMFQVNQAFSQFVLFIPALENNGAYFGILIAILVGIVIIGGIKSIAKVTAKIVPFMALFYILISSVIIIMNITEIGHVFGLIFNGAFNPSAMKGGFVGVMIVGFQRAAFSNEAGIGSAAIAHSSARTNEHIAEGLVAGIGPFIDTVIICTLTALVLIFTGFYNNAGSLEGAQLTSAAYGSVFSWFPYLLVIIVLLFAYSTMISWSYYGLKGFDFLFGAMFEKLFGKRKIADIIYRILFLIFIVIGASSSLGAVMDFSDMLILCMAFPNILGLLILSPEIKKDLNIYMNKIKTGEIKKNNLK